jgi:hypothetical protein
VEAWTGSYFQPSWLRQVGVVIHLGHDGLQCPSSDPSTGYNQGSDSDETDDIDEEGESDDDEELEMLRDTEPHPRGFDAWGNRLVVVVDISGVHTIGVRRCQCPSAPSPDIQFLDMGMFPASFTNPKAAFTFAVLDGFLIDNLECKTSAMNYFSKIRRVTSNAFPGTVPVCLAPTPHDLRLIILKNRYREFMRVTRQWRDLKSRKWHGFGHETNREPGKGELALFCPTCPQPGVNLPENWKEDPNK